MILRMTCAVAVSLAALAQTSVAELEIVRKTDENGVYEMHPVEIAPHAGVSVSAISVRNTLGHIKVRGHDGPNVTIRALKRAPSEIVLDRLKVKLVPDPSNGSVQIRTVLMPGEHAAPLRKDSVRIDLVVFAPRRARIRAHLRKGILEVKNMDNGASLKADLGDIKVQNCAGTITTSTVRGQQLLHEVFGSVDASSLVGDMELDTIHGSLLSAMVHRGSVTGRGIRAKHVSIRATIGNIVLHGDARRGGTYQVATHHGNIVLRFAEASRLAVTARARGGDVSLPASLRPAQVAPGVVSGTTQAPIATVFLGAHKGKVRVAWGRDDSQNP